MIARPAAAGSRAAGPARRMRSTRAEHDRQQPHPAIERAGARHRGRGTAMTSRTADGTPRDRLRWWDGTSLATWIVVNATAYIIIVAGGIVLETIASSFTRRPGRTAPCVGSARHRRTRSGPARCRILGRWQWRLLVTRMPTLTRRQWVTATFAPALIVWLLAIAPEAVDILAQGGDTVAVFKNGFVQALVLGPLIGLSQATALRADTARWMWWLASRTWTNICRRSGRLRVREIRARRVPSRVLDHPGVPPARVPDPRDVDALGHGTRSNGATARTPGPSRRFSHVAQYVMGEQVFTRPGTAAEPTSRLTPGGAGGEGPAPTRDPMGKAGRRLRPITSLRRVRNCGTPLDPEGGVTLALHNVRGTAPAPRPTAG